MTGKLHTYTGRLPTRSLGVHPPSGMAGENVPYGALETLLGLRTRLMAKLGTVAKGSYAVTDYTRRLEAVDAQIQQRRDMKKANPQAGP